MAPRRSLRFTWFTIDGRRQRQTHRQFGHRQCDGSIVKEAVIAAQAATWMMEQLTGNAVFVTQPGRTEQFTVSLTAHSTPRRAARAASPPRCCAAVYT